MLHFPGTTQGLAGTCSCQAATATNSALFAWVSAALAADWVSLHSTRRRANAPAAANGGGSVRWCDTLNWHVQCQRHSEAALRCLHHPRDIARHKGHLSTDPDHIG